ncbi:hypothetical protein [Nonomuraea sp. LPB2021202275-12-8]|uniref:hypothetical protein n=1 Tax=Nonomuraea sp. LPB2021202275-12-8 TaxID=3120159 RepID=UPI00300C1B66
MGAAAGLLALAFGITGVFGAGPLGGLLAATAAEPRSSAEGGGAHAEGSSGAEESRAGGGTVPSDTDARRASKSGNVASSTPGTASKEPQDARAATGGRDPEYMAADPDLAGDQAVRATPAETSGPDDPGLVDPDPGDTSGYKADGPSRHTDRRAIDFFRGTWGSGDKATRHIKDIRTVGRYLRIYTDLPETAGNSSRALTLCRRGLKYLKEGGIAEPVVFVQARFGENGNPVLANILGPADRDCRVTHPAPNRRP